MSTQARFGIKIAIDCPKFSYLLFVGDCLIFFKASKKAARVIKDILEHYRSFRIASQLPQVKSSIL